MSFLVVVTRRIFNLIKTKKDPQPNITIIHNNNTTIYNGKEEIVEHVQFRIDHSPDCHVSAADLRHPNRPKHLLQ